MTHDMKITFDDTNQGAIQKIEMVTDKRHIADVLDYSASIEEVLQRPFIIKEVLLSVPGAPYGIDAYPEPFTPIFQIDLPSELFVDVLKFEKVQNHRYMIGGVKIRVECNVQPMVCGQFIIFYDVYPKENFGDKFLDLNTNLTSLSSYPGVVFDINKQSFVELYIPFLAKEDAYDLQNFSDYARLYCCQITPIGDVSTSTDITMRVYGNFMDVKVFAPSAHLNPPPPAARKQLINKLTSNLNVLKANIQSARSENSKGPISTIAGVVSDIATAAGSIPIISDIAKPVGWVADIIGRVASIFGFSKPIHLDNFRRIINLPGYGFTYYTDKNEAVVLSSIPDNELGPSEGVFHTDIDELDLEYICRNPGIVNIIEYKANSKNVWLTTEYVGVKPKGKTWVYPDGSIPIARPTTGEYVARLFDKWNATVCYKIDVVKTPFHTGKLICSFDPSVEDPTITPLDSVGKTYTAVLDLAEKSEMIFKIPFMSNKPFLQTSLLGVTNRIFNFMGTFSVGALTPLQYNDNVVDTVSIVIWKWLEDVHFAEVASNDCYTFQKNFPPPSNVVQASIQINISNPLDANVVIVNNPRKLDLLKDSQDCIGERIVNLRTMLRMFRKQLLPETTPLKGLGYFIDPPIKITDYYISRANVNHITFLGKIFRFYRGGVSYKIIPNVTTSKYVRTSLCNEFVLNTLDRPPTHQHITFNDITPIHEVSLPFYGATRRRTVREELLTSNWDRACIRVEGVALKDSDCEIYQASDDCMNMAWLVGPPTLMKVDVA